MDSYSFYNSKVVYEPCQKRYSFKNWSMQRNQYSTDGFVVRRRAPNGVIGGQQKIDPAHAAVPSQYLINPAKQAPALESSRPMLTHPGVVGARPLTGAGQMALPKPQSKKAVDLDLSLDDTQKNKKQRKPKGLRKRPPLKKILKWAAIAVLVIGVGLGGYFGYKVFLAGSKIFKGNPIAAIFNQAKPLKADANGQSNILLFGTSEDDPEHPGAELTDSIMVLSVNQKRKDAFVVSVPRDLYVQYGHACDSGYAGKINVVYSCIKDKSGEDAGSAALRQKVGEIFGLDVQYSAHVNYTVLRDAVDAVGGITVNIQGDDPRGILDRNFDWDCPKGPRTCYNVKYPNGPATLNGKQALFLARARGDDSPGNATYGLSRSNPDRQDNQRKILLALKDKAVSAGVLTNPVAVNKLLDTLGTNLRTNFDADEVKTLLGLAKDVPSGSITSWSLEDPARALATVSCMGGNICPNKGTTNYSDIQSVAASLSTGDTSVLENAKVDVYNASGTPGLAQTKATELAAKGVIVGTVSNAPTSLGTKPIQLYDLTGGKKPGTLKKLQSALGVKVTAGAPAGITSSSDFVIVIGTPAAQTSAQSGN